jgi:predicted MPP superfamily phosphohydrolase
VKSGGFFIIILNELSLYKVKKYFLIIFSALLFVVLYLFIWNFYPKNKTLFFVFIILYILDLYLYWVYKNNIWRGSNIKGLIISTVFWFPMIMLVSMAVISLFNPYETWDLQFKTYYGGLIFAGYAAKVIPLILILLSDFIKLLRGIFGFSKPKIDTEKFSLSRSEFLKKIGILTGGLFFGTLTFGMFKWIYDFKIWNKVVHLPNLPRSFRGFRIVQISDIHLGSWLSKNEMREAVRIINELEADAVFFTGDLVNYSTDEAYPFEEILSGIKAKYGVFSVLGNHDYGDYKRWNTREEKAANLQEMHLLHKRLGWRLLNNENVIIRNRTDKIAILGVENWGSMKRFQKFGDLSQAVKGAENIPVKLLLSHDPSHWRLKTLNFNNQIDVTFAGHTHGAQFGIEIPGVRWSPSQYIYKYWAGFYNEFNRRTGKMQYLYVNRGLGSIGYPGRVGILPEITLVELQS